MAIELNETEKKYASEIKQNFTEEQMCAYFLTKTIRSQYQFNDDFVVKWYEEIFNHKPEDMKNLRRDLVQAYTNMLMFENKYQFHLDYWLREYQDKLIDEMTLFFSGKPGK